MTDTILSVECEVNVSCTTLKEQPGATIVSPILLSLSGVAGQIWALYYLYTSTRPQHSRTVFFVLLSTLIWTDLAGKVITTTPALVAYLHHSWVGGVPMCNFHGFSMMLVSLVTHLLVSTMAVERFIGIRHGYFYNKNITPTRTKTLLLGMWLFSVLYCALPLFGVGQYALQYPGSWCYLNIHVTGASPLHHVLYTNVFGFFTIVCLVIMVICNVVVITTLLCLRLCRERCCRSALCAPHRSSRQRELEMQMVIVLVVITVVFVLSWSPIDLRLFINQIRPHSTQDDHYQDLVAVRLTSVNQIVDPWVYIICRKVFMMRAWRWVRLSLLGTRLIGRESSTHQTTSHKKLTNHVLHRDPFRKLQYRTSFIGDAEGVEDEVVVVTREGIAVAMETGEEKENRLTAPPQHHPPPLPKDTTTTLTKEMMEGKELVEIFKDSGTGSNNNTPSTHCSDSETAAAAATPYSHNCDPACHGAGERTLGSLNVVPIPVFTCQQYRVEALGEPRHHPRLPPRLKRITSSASARDASTTRPPSYALHPDGRGRLVARVTYGRRHSWCCTQDGLEAKHYRTQSTQTFTHYQEEPRVSCCYYHHHHHHQRRQRDDYTSHVRHDHDQNLRNHSQRHPGDDHAFYHHNDLSPSYHGLLTPEYPHHGQQQHLDVYNNEQDDSVFIMANDFTPLNHDTDLTPDKKTNSVFSFMRRTSTPKHRDPEDVYQ